METNPDKLRQRFRQLTARAEKIRKAAGPERAKRDKLAQDHAAEIAKANAKVRAAEKGLFEIEQERAMLARALGGRTGQPG